MTNELAELTWFRRLILIFSCCILLVLILLWFLIPAKSLIAGLLLGGCISLYNVLYLARRVRITGQMAMAGTPGLAGSGVINRLIMIGFAIILAVRFPEAIDYRFLVLGFTMCYILLIIVAIIYARKERTKQEGRDVLGTESED